MKGTILETAIDVSMDNLLPIVGQGECVTVCYNQATVWQSRSMAAQFYLEAMCCSEGCERDRYTDVLLEIMAGNAICHDGVTKMLMWETEYR